MCTLHLDIIFSTSKNTDFIPSKCMAHKFCTGEKKRESAEAGLVLFESDLMHMLSITLSLILWKEYKLSRTIY